MADRREWITEYANAADDGAPYCGPVIRAGTRADAERILVSVSGPNGEPLTILGELMTRIPANVIGDTHTTIDREAQ